MKTGRIRRWYQPFMLTVFAIVAISIVVKRSNLVVAPEGEGAPYTLQGKVLRVSDGDTLVLESNAQQHQIRLASIDAPELAKGSDKPGQPYAQQAKAMLSQLVGQKIVELRCFEQDAHERDVCDVLIPNEKTANAQLVLQGLAWANQEKQGMFLRDKVFIDYEQQAKQKKRGLWSQPAVAPWQWRYQCWQQGKCE